MNFANNLVINTYSIMILSIICFHALKLAEKEFLPDKLYVMILYITILMLVVDVLSRFDGKPDTVYPIINGFGFQVFREESKTRQLFYPLYAINVINAVVLMLSQPFGWFYYIDSDNIYHRGPLFLFPAFITVALILSMAI